MRSAQRLSASQIHSPVATAVTFIAIMCAQRLSASQIHSLRVDLTTVGLYVGAQRLSASQIHSHRNPSSGREALHVLNAFRHLRFIHASMTS